ncbi:transglutaminase domain-containing protein [Roseateles amylovorans]|uniref:Transglutaminase domain-containing protein n=1 Tax=Roseateles amylovorans TaxID=2978473 RepID=A0ABY6AWA6_9BURK|nr:transglutaminase domain-containing protein [Roseateles amylovorans]UXH76086.1 transglutaminase domain-containing protein [Roseateles amylovorans]
MTVPAGAEADAVDGAPFILRRRVDVFDRRADGVLRTLLERFRNFRFFMLPEVCRWNLDFIQRHRMCECGGAARLLVHEAGAAGLQARLCFGLLMAEPYSTGHYWAELRLDDDWVPFDPLLLGLLHRVTRLSAQQWPIHRANRPMLHRLGVVERFESHGAPVVDGVIDPAFPVSLRIMSGQTFVATLPTTFSRAEDEAAEVAGYR